MLMFMCWLVAFGLKYHIVESDDEHQYIMMNTEIYDQPYVDHEAQNSKALLSGENFG